MTNTLYLPELREMLSEHNSAELAEFCTALHPARTAEFMEGLDAAESWEVLQHTDPQNRAEIFAYFDPEKQVAIIESADRSQVAELVSRLPSDERVDILEHADSKVVDEILDLLPADDRRNILRLREYPEGTAGAVMSTNFARLSEHWTDEEALAELRRQAEELETVYYLYVVDASDHLRGLVSLRELVLAKPNVKIGDIMQREVVSVRVTDDQEEVARQLARFDFLAIPVIDRENRLVGIVTYDDVIDVVREEATEDAHRIAGVAPLELGYLETSVASLTWKRGMWLGTLFCVALITTWTLSHYEDVIAGLPWLIFFLPLINSSGGNTGNQSATLVITALATGDVKLSDWLRVALREMAVGVLLGLGLGTLGFLAAIWSAPSPWEAIAVGTALFFVVLLGAAAGTLLPLGFRSMGLDPALMSNPAVACLIDLMGVVIYMTVAIAILEIPVLEGAPPLPTSPGR